MAEATLLAAISMFGGMSISGIMPRASGANPRRPVTQEVVMGVSTDGDEEVQSRSQYTVPQRSQMPSQTVTGSQNETSSLAPVSLQK